MPRKPFCQTQPQPAISSARRARSFYDEGLCMMQLPALNPPVRTLMGPGPSDIHPRVLAALARPTVGHLDPYYLQLMDRLQSGLRELFRTKNRMTFAVSGTG